MAKFVCEVCGSKIEKTYWKKHKETKKHLACVPDIALDDNGEVIEDPADDDYHIIGHQEAGTIKELREADAKKDK